MRVTNERLARLLDSGAITAEVKLWRGTGVEHTSVEDVLLDLRDERALADKLAEALRASWDMSMAVRTSNLSDEVRAALAAYDAERGKR